MRDEGGVMIILNVVWEKKQVFQMERSRKMLSFYSNNSRRQTRKKLGKQ